MNVLCPQDKGNLDPIGLRRIDRNKSQMLIDDYLIENRFDADMLTANVPHVFHPPERLADPLINPDKPWEKEAMNYPGVVFDSEAELFRMYYTIYHSVQAGPNYPPGTYFLGYAESRDGMHWEKPDLGLHPWGNEGQTNIVMQGTREALVSHVHMADPSTEGEIRNIGLVPEKFLRGHRFVMYYCDFGHYLATSEDGIHWKPKVQQLIANRIDCYQTLVYDEDRKEFVSYLRNKLIFGSFTKYDEDFGGNTRAISRLSGPDWWSEWDRMPTGVLLPDLGDGRRFYAMPTFIYGGVYWGFLHHFHEDPQAMEVELVFSRNGIEWSRLADRPRLLPTGEPGTWDGGMVFSSDRPIERGDEWWIYYSGVDGYHGNWDNTGAIGLAKLRKEGFVSLQAGDMDSYVLTRPLQWPGGSLQINAAARDYIRVRVTDLRRNTLTGLGFDDCVPFQGDSTRHQVRWKNTDIAGLEGEVIRIEFKFRRGDLYSFIAAP